LKFFDNVDSSVWFKLSSTGLQGHNYKLFKQPYRLNIRQYLADIVLQYWYQTWACQISKIRSWQSC